MAQHRKAFVFAFLFTVTIALISGRGSFFPDTARAQSPEESPSPEATGEPPPPEPQAMDPGDFAALMKALKAESFPKGKLAVLREAARRNRFRVAQLRHVMQEFSFADGKLQAAAAIHPVLVDPQNFYKVYQDLQFESDKLKLRRMIGE